MSRNTILRNYFFRPGGYYRTAKGFANVLKKAGYYIPIPDIEYWLKRQEVWQIHCPPPRYIARPTNEITIPNLVHEADILYLSYDCVYGNIFMYVLVVVDKASRYLATVPLTDRSSETVAKAFWKIYTDPLCPLIFPE